MKILALPLLCVAVAVHLARAEPITIGAVTWNVGSSNLTPALTSTLFRRLREGSDAGQTGAATSDPQLPDLVMLSLQEHKLNRVDESYRVRRVGGPALGFTPCRLTSLCPLTRKGTPAVQHPSIAAMLSETALVRQCTRQPTAL